MKKTILARPGSLTASALVLMAIITGSRPALGQSVDFPTKKWGISFGNSKQFTGLRFNFRDSQVSRIRGVNVTFWHPKKDNPDAVVEGLSLGLVPGGGYMKGIQIGLLGVAAEKNMAGFNVGLLGMGAGDKISGINIGGLGAGAGKSIVGFNVGGLGIGAGDNAYGINIGGLGVGAGKDTIGINIGGLGIGAGDNLIGINIAGLGAGAGKKLAGLTVCGLGAGSEEIQGLTLAGIGLGGETLKGVQVALGMVRVTNNGRMIGFAASAFNYIKGSQTGLSIGLVNYAYSLKGVQIGLINIVRDNPRYLKVLPIMNANFRR